MKPERWWVCHVKPMNMDSWVKATTASKAKFKVWRAANEAGYQIKFGDLRVRLDRSGLEPLLGTVVQ